MTTPTSCPSPEAPMPAVPAEADKGVEPVAWRARHSFQEKWYLFEHPVGWWECEPLYAAPSPVLAENERLKGELHDEVMRNVLWQKAREEDDEAWAKVAKALGVTYAGPSRAEMIEEVVTKADTAEASLASMTAERDEATHTLAFVEKALTDRLTLATRERDEAKAAFDEHDELLHQCIDDRNYYRERVQKAEADAALHIECNERQYARLGGLRTALETAREALAISYNVTTYPGDGTSKQDKAIAAIDKALARTVQADRAGEAS